MPLSLLLDVAWSTREKARPPILEASYPTRTMAVSVTGKSCALNCSHCEGRYLQHMVDIKDLPREIVRRKPKSILLSGGCGPKGNVPVKSHIRKVLDCIDTAGLNVRLNVHPGILEDEDAIFLSEVAQTISFDFVLDEQAIREAFHGNWTKEDYIRTYRALRKGKARVVPHVLVGLNKGRISGEYEALEFLLREETPEVIFIVFIPTPGTLWQDESPPPVEEVLRLFAYARLSQPGLKMILGCMRPSGSYRKELDRLSVGAGIDGIVLPHPRALGEARERGLDVLRKEECCAFE